MTLSVVLIIASDTVRRPAGTAHLARALRRLKAQRPGAVLEIIVPHVPAVEGLRSLQAEHPDVVWLEVRDLRRWEPRRRGRDHHDELRARGVAVARGEVVALVEDHEVVGRDWAEQMIAAHAGGAAAIGGAIEQGGEGPLTWAVFLCDFARYQRPFAPGASSDASDVNVSYKRGALAAIGDVWRDRFQEREVHQALRGRGHAIVLDPRAVVYQNREGLTLRDAVLERVLWGESYARVRCETWGAARRLLYAALAPALPALLVLRIGVLVFRKRRPWPFLQALPLVALLTTAWAVGELIGYARATPGKRSTQARLYSASPAVEERPQAP